MFDLAHQEMKRRGATTRSFRDRLRRARVQKGWSQADLAAVAGLQQSALSHYENGARRPSFTNLRRLATALDVSTDYLVGKASARKGGEEQLAREIARLRPADQEIVRVLVNSLLRDQSR
jgi:transcriptional regulator with XRE-family HTH domain